MNTCELLMETCGRTLMVHKVQVLIRLQFYYKQIGTDARRRTLVSWSFFQFPHKRAVLLNTWSLCPGGRGGLAIHAKCLLQVRHN